MPVQMRFGSFFRGKRLAMRLTLREFCRRNGLDPGNISRMERGVQPPPQSHEVLETYAKTLNLLPGSEERQLFFELAAAETGRIPQQALKDRTAKEQLSKAIRDLRPRSRSTSPWITSVELQNWADYRDSQAQFPRLIRRLVHATNGTVERIEFPAGEGVQRRGWDGVVMATSGTPYVPAGLSVWELGTGSNPKRKADEDFRRRTENPLGVKPSEATFVLVTPRRWEGKDEWEVDKNKLAIWRNVLVYDADTLEAWLEKAPSVDVWFSRILGKRPPDMRDPDEHWANLSEITSPSLKPAVFLASRKKETDELKTWLSGPPSALAIESRSPVEAIDFLSAYLAANVATTSDSECSTDADAARTTIVESMQAWNSLAEEVQPLNLVAAPGLALDAESIAKAVRLGHHVLLCATRFNSGQFRTLTLSRPSCFDLETALVESGIESSAAKKAGDCGGSLTVLKRRIARFPSTIEPEWSHPDRVGDLSFLILLGRWNGSCPGDRDIVEELANRPYADVSQAVQLWSRFPDPPVFQLLDEWNLTSREDSWLFLRDYLTPDLLGIWQSIAVKVLGEDDPRLDLPVAEQPFAQLTGKVPTYSDALRTGIAETLAVMATVTVSQDVASESSRVESIVRQVLGKSPGWKRWASLSNQLRLLAEAAPDAFLAALESDLDQAMPETPKLFADPDESFFSKCHHAALLWSLETLAWSPRYLLPVSLILARLDELDTGKKWSNRPAQSLAEILLPWLPHTTALVQTRINVLQVLAKRYPGPAWRLMLNLLHGLHGISTSTPQPKWRDWTIGNWPQGASNKEYADQTEACGRELVAMVGTAADRWIELIQHAAELPATWRSEITSRLSTINKCVFNTDELIAITNALRLQVRRNTDYPDAEWALPPEDVMQFEQALLHLEPDDIVAKHTWLFSRWPEFPRTTAVDASAVDDRDKAIAKARLSALTEVFNKHGFEGVLRLIDQVDEDYCALIVGETLAQADLVDESRIIPQLLNDASPRVAGLARGFAYVRLRSDDWTWIDRQQLRKWTSEQLVCLGNVLLPQMKTWKLLANNSEVAFNRYWETVSNFYGINDEVDRRYAVTMLLEHQRPFAAATVLRSALDQKVAIDTEQVLSVLEAGLKQTATRKDDDSSKLSYSLQMLIQYLQSPENSVNPQRLAALEFGYLEILDGRPVSAVTLHLALSTEPRFFADVVASAYYPKKTSENDRKKGDGDRERMIARIAQRALNSWERIPGRDANNRIDDAFLREWVLKARELCRATDHLEIGDMQIGEVFAQSPHEADGSWPCVPIRDVIDETGSEDLIEGFVIGTLNTRGVSCKSPFEGGEQERELAKKYEGYARQSDDEWPATAKALRAIAQQYAGRAHHEDAGAEGRRVGR